MKGFLAFVGCLSVLCGESPAAEPATRRNSVLLEAEQFGGLGGWVLDPQFMDQMGSPFLLAHGLGRPVGDAETTLQCPASGAYRVFVRTRDWVAPWNVPGAPGRFQVLVNGQPLAAIFGTEGAQWHWQDGGTVTISSRSAEIALHDLTGFEGRCDAVFFTRLTDFTPPNQEPELSVFRRRMLGQPDQPETREFDFVVAGGGMAGTCASIAAARLGLRVALVQDRPVLGGNNSSEVRVWLQGARNKEPWPRVGDVVAELEQSRRAHYGPANTAELYEDEKKLALARAETNLTLFLEHRAVAVETSAGRVRAVIAQDVRSGRRVCLAAPVFADCTGDGVVGSLAGADFDMAPKGRMGPCNLWNVAETVGPVSFPRCPWALDLSRRPFPGRGRGQEPPNILHLGGWYWESGFDRDPFTEMEYVRDWNFRAMYGAWDALKNVDKVLPNHALNWSAHILGKRESRRLLGDVVLTLEDLKEGRSFPDGCVPTGWKVDLHLPDPRYEKGFEGDAFIARAQFGAYPMPFWVPYRCLYSRNVPNLFMAGRDISVTHEALGAVRVMRTGGCMGEIVGMAASLCHEHHADPRAIYELYLGELQDLMRRGAGKNPGANPNYENQGEPPQRTAAVGAATSGSPEPNALRQQVLRSLRRAVAFFREEVAVHGTYLWQYSEDLSRREGEGVATATCGWVQPPGTPSVGLAFLRAYAATDDIFYLEAARETAHGLVRGQLQSGGWTYVVEFDPAQRKKLAFRDGGQATGRNITTLDDDTTQAALRFLMRTDQVLAFKDAKIHECVEYALNSLLKAQYPNGAWPQGFDRPPGPAKFPVKRASYPESWSRTWPGSGQYWQRYTLNDNALTTTLETMLEAGRVYGPAAPGNDLTNLAARCRAAAEKGGDFLLLAQMPEPQPAWAQQYDFDMHPAWARKFEPPAVTGGESHGVMRMLLQLYHETGQRKYLEPIPRALDYLRRSRLPDGRLARFYELRTNKPLYFTTDYQLTFDDRDTPTHYAFKVSDGTATIARDYERFQSLSPERLKALGTRNPPRANPALVAEVNAVLAAQDARGRWIEEGGLRFHRPKDPTSRVIRCETFIRHVENLSRYLEATRD